MSVVITVDVYRWGGTGVTDPSGVQSYPAGSQVTLTAIPDTGFVFDRWRENKWNGVEDFYVNPLVITANVNRSFSAIFKVPPTPPETLRNIQYKAIPETYYYLTVDASLKLPGSFNPPEGIAAWNEGLLSWFDNLVTISGVPVTTRITLKAIHYPDTHNLTIILSADDPAELWVIHTVLEDPHTASPFGFYNVTSTVKVYNPIELPPPEWAEYEVYRGIVIWYSSVWNRFMVAYGTQEYECGTLQQARDRIDFILGPVAGGGINLFLVGGLGLGLYLLVKGSK